jgi:two-component system, cell cycle sensor histidine kinase and response regulator CckA
MTDIDRHRARLSSSMPGKAGLWEWDLRDDPSGWEPRVHPDDLPRIKERIAQCVADPAAIYQAEYRVRHDGDSWRWLRAQADLVRDAHGRPDRLIGGTIDITELKLAELELARVKCAVRALTECRQALLRGGDDDALLDEVCRALVDTGGYRVAWIGLAVGDDDAGLRQAARAGSDADLDACTSCAAEVHSPAPARLAMRSQEPTVARCQRSRRSGGSSGCGASAALPLVDDGRAVGTLCVASGEAAAFAAEETGILAELARDVGSTIAARRSRGQRDRSAGSLGAAERQLRTLVDNLPDYVVRFDRDCRHLFVNPALVREIGAPAEFFLGKSPSELGATGDPARDADLEAGIRRAFEEGVANTIEAHWPTRRGERCFEIRHIPERDETGKTVSVLGIARDITGQRDVEEALRQQLSMNEARDREFRLLADNIPDFIVRWDRDLRRVYVNPAFARAAARPAEQLIGTRYGTGYSPAVYAEVPDSIAAIERTIRQVFASGQPAKVELPWVTAAGKRFSHIHIEPERDESGAIATVIGIGRDITELKETERKFLTLTEHSPDVIVRHDREGRCLYANSAIEEMTGVPAHEFVGRRVAEATAGRVSEEVARSLQSLRAMLEQVLATGRGMEAEVSIRFPDRERVFNVRLVPERDEGGQIVSILDIARDITAAKHAEEALRASEQRFRQVTENVGEVFWLSDVAKAEVMYVSPAYQRVWGRTCDSLYEQPQSWMDAIHPDDRARVREAALTRQTAGDYDVEYRIVRPDGDVRWVRDRAFPINDADGRVYRVAGVAEDITARRQLEEQLRQSQKMEAIGQLAGGIAHDFNNMLVVIQLQTSLLADSRGEDLKEGIAQIAAATERAARLTRQLLTFSRREVRHSKDIDLAEVTSAMITLLWRLLGEDIALETRFAPDLPLIDADPGMMEQVLMNLAVNARDAMPDGGRMTISLDAVTIEADDAIDRPNARPGRFVCLGVTDSGCGIAPEHLPHIFEPFFTTKEVGRGTGLGLATVFGIAEQHMGWVEVTSQPGQGTAFHVYLPALPPTAARRARETRAEHCPGGSETILLVEDDAAVRRLARRVLDRRGYRVLEAASGADALAVWEAEPGRVDLLLTDLVMPGGMSGHELARELCARQPALKVIYTSGYTDDIVNRRLRLDPGSDLLQKPYPAHQLAIAVRRCLDGA